MNIENRNSRLKFKNVARSIKVPSIREEGLDGSSARGNLSLDGRTLLGTSPLTVVAAVYGY